MSEVQGVSSAIASGAALGGDGQSTGAGGGAGDPRSFVDGVESITAAGVLSTEISSQLPNPLVSVDDAMTAAINESSWGTGVVGNFPTDVMGVKGIDQGYGQLPAPQAANVSIQQGIIKDTQQK
jgi:hypothetical protein